jgi:hypothetical protein
MIYFVQTAYLRRVNAGMGKGVLEYNGLKSEKISEVGVFCKTRQQLKKCSEKSIFFNKWPKPSFLLFLTTFSSSTVQY